MEIKDLSQTALIIGICYGLYAIGFDGSAVLWSFFCKTILAMSVVGMVLIIGNSLFKYFFKK